MVELTESKPKDRGAGIVVPTNLDNSGKNGTLGLIRLRASPLFKRTLRKHVMEAAAPHIGLRARAADIRERGRDQLVPHPLVNYN